MSDKWLDDILNSFWNSTEPASVVKEQAKAAILAKFEEAKKEAFLKGWEALAEEVNKTIEPVLIKYRDVNAQPKTTEGEDE